MKEFIELGKKVKETLLKRNIGVFDIKIEQYISKTSALILSKEEKKKEFRIELGKIYTLENLEDDYGCTSIEELGSPTLEKDFKKDLNKIGKVIENDYRQSPIYSVFLEESYINDPDLELICLGLGLSYYQKIIKLFGDEKDIMFDEYMTAYLEHIEEFKDALYGADVFISNHNIELIEKFSYRLYKDGKFFYELKRLLDDSNYAYSNLMQDLNLL